MKILLYSLNFPPDVCANAYVFSDLSKEFARMGHEIAILTTTAHFDESTAMEKRKLLSSGKKDWYMKSSFDGMPVYHIVVAPQKGGIKQRIQTYYRFHHYAKKLVQVEDLRADVVLAQTPPFTVGISAHGIAKKLRAKSVMILQDLLVDSMADKGMIKGPLKWALLFAEKISLRQSDALTTISEEMAQLIRAKIGTEKKLAVIPNFVDTSLYHQIDEDFRKEYDLSPDDFVISYAGNIGWAQDMTPLIALARKLPKVKILIAGTGINKETYEEIVEKEQLKSVRFLGYVSREETIKINAVSDLCMIMLAKHVMATSYPSKTYSLMAMGKPIVITCNKNSDVGRFIDENQIGFHVDVEDTDAFVSLVETLMENRQLLKQYGENSVKLIEENFSGRVVSKKYDELFQKLIDKE